MSSDQKELFDSYWFAYTSEGSSGKKKHWKLIEEKPKTSLEAVVFRASFLTPVAIGNADDSFEEIVRSNPCLFLWQPSSRAVRDHLSRYLEENPKWCRCRKRSGRHRLGMSICQSLCSVGELSCWKSHRRVLVVLVVNH